MSGHLQHNLDLVHDKAQQADDHILLHTSDRSGMNTVARVATRILQISALDAPGIPAILSANPSS